MPEWENDCPVALDVSWKSVNEHIQDIVTYMPQLRLAPQFHSKDIKFLLEAVIKHFLRHSEYPFQENDLELEAYISKELRKATVPSNKELHLVLQH